MDESSRNEELQEGFPTSPHNLAEDVASAEGPGVSEKMFSTGTDAPAGAVDESYALRDFSEEAVGLSGRLEEDGQDRLPRKYQGDPSCSAEVRTLAATFRKRESHATLKKRILYFFILLSSVVAYDIFSSLFGLVGSLATVLVQGYLAVLLYPGKIGQWASLDRLQIRAILLFFITALNLIGFFSLWCLFCADARIFGPGSYFTVYGYEIAPIRTLYVLYVTWFLCFDSGASCGRFEKTAAEEAPKIAFTENRKKKKNSRVTGSPTGSDVDSTDEFSEYTILSRDDEVDVCRDPADQLAKLKSSSELQAQHCENAKSTGNEETGKTAVAAVKSKSSTTASPATSTAANSDISFSSGACNTDHDNANDGEEIIEAPVAGQGLRMSRRTSSGRIASRRAPSSGTASPQSPAAKSPTRSPPDTPDCSGDESKPGRFSSSTHIAWTVYFVRIFLDTFSTSLRLFFLTLREVYTMIRHPRRFDRFCPSMRRRRVYRHAAMYFPVKLTRTRRLDPDKVYMFGYHPHGVLSVGALLNFSTFATGFDVLFPGVDVRLLTMKVNFRIPFWRDFLLALGLQDVSAESICNNLQRGKSVALVPGGARESLESTVGSNVLILGSRKGFVKYAIKNGASLVPVYSFGETDLFGNVELTGWKKRAQDKAQKLMGFALPLIVGRALTGGLLHKVCGCNYGIFPFRTPVHSVVGNPIVCPKVENPTQDEIDRYHQLYVRELKRIYEDWSAVYEQEKRDRLAELEENKSRGGLLSQHKKAQSLRVKAKTMEIQ
mmetsp:Transcript_8900/g.21702  ORF Transcript_8900/g.21702 Transcript_8900/m.21702 type:complete len:776 (-) Transcript_8900:809-3136(-)